MPAIYPQPVGGHPATQRLARYRATVICRQLLGSKGRAKVGVALAHEGQHQSPHLARQSVVARFAAPLGDQAAGPVLLDPTFPLLRFQ